MDYFDYVMMMIDDGVDAEEAVDIAEDQFGLSSDQLNSIWWRLENNNLV